MAVPSGAAKADGGDHQLVDNALQLRGFEVLEPAAEDSLSHTHTHTHTHSHTHTHTHTHTLTHSHTHTLIHLHDALQLRGFEVLEPAATIQRYHAKGYEDHSTTDVRGNVPNSQHKIKTRLRFKSGPCTGVPRL